MSPHTDLVAAVPAGHVITEVTLPVATDRDSYEITL